MPEVTRIVHYMLRTTDPQHGDPSSKSACGKTLKANHAHTREADEVTCKKCLRTASPDRLRPGAPK